MINKTSFLFGHSDSSRLLALGGVLLILLGMLLGEIYAIYISHVANGIIRQSWTEVVDAAGRGDISAIKQYFAIIYDLTEKRGRFMNTHSHIGSYGLLALAFAIIQPMLNLSSKTKRYLAQTYLLGAILQLSGVYISYYVKVWPLYLSDLGAIMVIIAVTGILFGLFRQRTDETIPTLNNLVKSLLQAQVSRFLLKAGILLILAGMIFGLYHAWRLVTQEEQAIYTAIDTAAEKVEQGDIESAKSSIADFKRQQSKVAITSAAHSHAIEFGFLLLLLAFIQHYVFLKEEWRQRWAIVTVLGACCLPVCVYLATIYGLRAAAFADLSGGLVMAGLFAMSIGLIRHTGITDFQSNGIR